MSINDSSSNYAGRAWLASLILSRPKGFMSRLALGLSRLGAMPRGWRRRLRRRAAVTVAGAALILSMAGSAFLAPPAHAAAITVNTGTGVVANDGACSLVEAILNANYDTRVFSVAGECATGSGADTITLGTNVTLTYDYTGNLTGLPVVTSDILIEGNGHTISAPNAFEDPTVGIIFRIFEVDTTGDLELRDVALTGGASILGGSIYSAGDLTLSGVTIRDAVSIVGGGIAHRGGELIIEDSLITHNFAYGVGGGIASYGFYAGTDPIRPNVTISGGSLITGNYSYDVGGGIASGYADVTLEGSTISRNVAGTAPADLEPDFVDQALSSRAAPARLSVWGKQGAERSARGFMMTRAARTGTMDVLPQDDTPTFYGIAGGVYSSYLSTFTATDSTISGNRAGLEAGGVFNNFMSTTAIYHSTISNNNGGITGGGLVNVGELTMLYSTVDGNEAYYGGGVMQMYGSGIIRYSTISSNEANIGTYGGGIGGGVMGSCGLLKIRNSTISNNTAEEIGGGVYVAYSYDGKQCNEEVGEKWYRDGVLMDHTTITGNTAGDTGGGVARRQGEGPYGEVRWMQISGSIVSGNTANGVDGVDNVSTVHFSDFSHGNNIFGADGVSGVDGFTPTMFEIVPPSGVTLADILMTTLADNGGPTKTHLLVAGSLALDKDNNINCELPENVTMTDQRGRPRNQDADGVASTKECDIGAVEGIESFAPPPIIYMSAKKDGATADGLAFDNSDILKWDGSVWAKVFDGSDAQLFPKKSKHNVNSFWVNGDEIIMSFAQNGRKVPGIDPKVEGTDLVRWDGNAFSLWFDGSNVGLDKKGAEKIDGLHVLPGDHSPIGGSCIAYLLISTQSKGAVPAYGGGQIKFGGEDILGFCMTNQGAATAGFWHVVLDGSAEGLPKNIIDSISVGEDGQTIYFTTRKKINLGGVSGGPSAVFAYDAGNISGPLFVAAANGLTQPIDGLDMQ